MLVSIFNKRLPTIIVEVESENALDDIAAAWTKETGKTAPKISYGASSALAKQLEQAAPADLLEKRPCSCGSSAKECYLDQGMRAADGFDSCTQSRFASSA